MFPGIGALPEPATESHVVNRGTPVAPCHGHGRLKAQRKRVTRVGSPMQPSFPKYHELFEEPHHCKAADDSLTAKPQALGTLPSQKPVYLGHKLGGF